MTRPNTTDTTSRFITRMADNLWRAWITYAEKDFGQHYFSDKEYGSKDASLAAAKLYRDNTVKTHGIPLRSYGGNGFCVQHKNNKSGVVGISLIVDTRDDPKRVSWQAKFMVDGEQCQAARSIRRYGYTGAWKMVAKIREKHTKIAVSKNPPLPPEWLRLWAAERDVSLPEEC